MLTDNRRRSVEAPGARKHDNTNRITNRVRPSKPGSVKSNPPVQEIQWTFEKEPLTFDKSQGVLAINHTLILQQVKKERRGNYACIARNSLGESTSQPFFLKIKCKTLSLSVWITLQTL